MHSLNAKKILKKMPVGGIYSYPLAQELWYHYTMGTGRTYHVKWSYLSKDRAFTNFAKKMKVGQTKVYGAKENTDLGLALDFSVSRTAVHTYSIHDSYDFEPVGATDTILWVFIGGPFTVIGGAQDFKVYSSGRL